MIQAVGLTSTPRRGRPPAVDDLTFEACAGEVTVLLGPADSGASEVPRLMLQLSPGRGVALFRGRPLSRVPHPPREIGVLLGDVPGHPRRTVRGQLRLLAALAGVPDRRVEEALEAVGMSGLARTRLAALSRGMERRLGLAVALLGDPHTLLLDDPARGLAPRERAWLAGLLRTHADQGGTVLLTSDDSREAALLADRVVSLDGGRLLADQRGEDFARTRLRPRVVVRTPHADRLAAALTGALEPGLPAGAGARPEVVRESGTVLTVYGSEAPVVGELAHRHRVLVHHLAETRGRTGDRWSVGPLRRADGREAERLPGAGSPPAPALGRAPKGTVDSTAGDGTEGKPVRGAGSARPGAGRTRSRGGSCGGGGAALPPRLPAATAARPLWLLWPLRYELRRWLGLAPVWWLAAATLLVGLAAAGVMAAPDARPPVRTLAGWPDPWPLPVAALAAGATGAVSFDRERRHPVLAAACRPASRRLSLLGAGLVVGTAVALVLCGATLGLNVTALTLLLAAEGADGAEGVGALGAVAWASALLDPAVPAVGCAWTGVLAAHLCRSSLAGLAAVAALPPLLASPPWQTLAASAPRPLGELADRLASMTGVPFLSWADPWVLAPAHLAPQPVGWALALALAAVLGGYAYVALRGGTR
ncbi:ATP-binding cassette domain-containing protein [Streptomyces sp. 4N509B]|uniref:ATP-binding cassette domain-containing protein n=1 Tax=Streptomyces sp. 4N509B TaxID=3457413 RepID=UPI003FD0D1ED